MDLLKVKAEFIGALIRYYGVSYKQAEALWKNWSAA